MIKETIKIAIIGHIDHGKSTLIGRLLLETNSLPKERVIEIKEISKEFGKDVELAYLVDQLKEEREQNKSIDTTQIFLKTRKRNYVIIDTPGHVEFIKNMITGASLANVAVLILDIQEGIMEQTRRHLYIIDLLGINKVGVVLNKMDLINYQREPFDKVKNELLKFLKNLNIETSFIIPVSAKEGTNISKKSFMLRWYRGPSLLYALDSLISNTEKFAKKPLRFSVQDVYEINGEKIIVGKVIAGIIRKGQKVIVLPHFKYVTIKSIKVIGGYKTVAKDGENIGLVLNESLNINRGTVFAQKENPPPPKTRFKGHIFWMSNCPLEINKTVTLRCATQETRCIIEKIEKRIDSSTLEIKEENAKELKLNEAGIVIFNTEKSIVIEKFPFIEELGRFIIEQGYDLQGAGIIKELLY